MIHIIFYVNIKIPQFGINNFLEMSQSWSRLKGTLIIKDDAPYTIMF